MKKVISLCLAVVMVLGMTTVAFAAGTQEATIANQGYNVDLVGTATKNAVLISVVMPTSIDFAIQTEKVTQSSSMTLASSKNVSAADVAPTDADSNATAYGTFKALSSGTATVTNNSDSNVKLEVVSATNTKGNLLNLADLSLKSAGVEDSTIAKTVTLVEKKDYTQGTDGVLADTIGAKAAGNTSGDSITLKVFGSEATISGGVKVNIPDGDYTIQTTLKVSIAA